MTHGEARVLATHLLQALAHAHAHGVYHLDVKPENVLVGPRPTTPPPSTTTPDPTTYVLTDWGSAAMGEDRPPAFGTPQYMAPEVAAAGPSGPPLGTPLGPLDVYSLGRTLAVVLTLCGAPVSASEAARGPAGTSTGTAVQGTGSQGGGAAGGQGGCPVLADFLGHMLAWAPEARWTACQLLAHKFVVEGCPHCACAVAVGAGALAGGLAAAAA